MTIKKMDFEKKKILVVGDMILDEYLFGEVNRISPEAPVPILNVLNTEIRLGGAANVAFNCKSLGCDVDIVSVVGHDKEGETLIRKLKERNINCFIEKSNQFKTIKKTRLIGNSQQILRIDEEKRPPELIKSSINIFIERVKVSDVIIFSDYDKGILNNLPKLIEQANKYKKICLVDPKGNDPSKFRGANVLTPNSNEIDKLIGYYNDENDFIIKIFEMMKINNIKNIVLTKGKKGITLFQHEKKHELNFQANPSEVFDVTGAGDTVISVLSALLSINYPLENACEIANKAGGIIVQKFGTTSINFEEIFE